MTRRLAFRLCLVTLLPTSLLGQEGSIAYTHSVEIEIDEELRARFERFAGREGFPTRRTEQVVLIFNGTESLMKPVPPEEGEGHRGRGAVALGDAARDIYGLAARLQSSSTARAARETLVEAYTRYAEGTIVERRELLGRDFLIEDERPPYQWKLSGEQAEFLGYVVQKATAARDSTAIEAWFTPQIPVMGGPGPYGGLPGMILVVSVDDGKEQYTATAVSMSAVAEGVIVPPDEGEAVSRHEYETIVAAKLEELRTSRRRRRP